jgi:hypothetical protein
MTDHTSSQWTFVAKFADGIVTRMSTFCAGGEFDLRRGIALARTAYESRTGRPPPLLVAVKFVKPDYHDIVLKEYDRNELLEASAS